MPSSSQPFALLMDSLAAKDLGCLLGGYYKLLVDPNVSVFRLGRPKVRVHRIPAEEGVCGRFAVIEGVCYESLSSEQKLFHLKQSLSGFGLFDRHYFTSHEYHQSVLVRIKQPFMCTISISFCFFKELTHCFALLWSVFVCFPGVVRLCVSLL